MNTLPKGQAIDFTKIRRVLVTKLRFHGDVLLSSPVFSALKKHYPHLEIDGLIYRETYDMLSLHPAVDNIFTIDRNWKKQGLGVQFKEERQLFSQLKNRHYDLLIHLTEDWRGLILKQGLNIPFAVCADYPRRRSSNFWYKSFSHIYSVSHERNKVASHLDALRQLGIYPTPEEQQLQLGISDEDQGKVDRLLSQKGLTETPYLLIHPTSRFFYKCWPPEICAQLINALHEKNIPVVLTAAPSSEESQYVSRIKEKLSSPVVDLSGQLCLKQLAAVIKRSHCFIGVDSAPMHIATAMQIPSIALFGVTNAKIWGPLGKHVEIMQSGSRLEKPEKINGRRPNTIDNCILDIVWQKALNSALRYFQ